MARDWKDTMIIKEFFKERNPIEYGSVLCNIANGVHAGANVNVDNAEVIGNSILAKMVGEKVQGFSFKRKDQAVTLASAVKVNGEPYQFDPQVLFQRLAWQDMETLRTRLTMNYVSFHLLWLNQLTS